MRITFDMADAPDKSILFVEAIPLKTREEAEAFLHLLHQLVDMTWPRRDFDYVMREIRSKRAEEKT